MMKRLLALFSVLAGSAMAAYQPAGPYAAFVTTNLLASGGNYTSAWISAQGYSQVQTHILASHNGTLTFQFAEDSAGVDVVRTLSLPYVAANGYQLYAAPVFADYIKYSFTNTSGETQTDMYYETKFLTTAINPQILRLDAPIAGGMMANVSRSVLMGRTIGGFYENIQNDGDGNLEVNVKNPRSAFGELKTINPTPVAQVDFVYGINANLIQTNVTGSGAVSAANQQIEVSSGAAASSTAEAYTKRYMKYRPGQGALGRYTARFDAAKAGNRQYAGLFTPSMSDGFGFGYDSNGVFGVVRIDAGTETWTAQTAWNKDVCDGSGGSTNSSGISLSHTNGNVYQVSYQYLGFGAIYYSIENPTDGSFTLVHIDQYAGTSADTSVSQPSLNMTWRSDNGTNETAVVVRGASGALFLEGERRFLGPRYGDDSSAALTEAGGQQNVMAIRNATTYNGVANRAQIRLRSVSLGSVSTVANPDGAATLRIVKNPDGVLTNFVAIDGATADFGVTVTSGQSVASVDKVSNVTSNGVKEFIANVGVNSSETIDLSGYDLFLNPADVMTYSVEISGDNQTISVSGTWVEDQ